MAAQTLGVGEGLSEQVEGGMEGEVLAHRRQGHKKERARRTEEKREENEEMEEG